MGGRGVVKVGDSRWQVTLEGGDSLPKGTLVEVVAQHDTRLVVRPLAASVRFQVALVRPLWRAEHPLLGYLQGALVAAASGGEEVV